MNHLDQIGSSDNSICFSLLQVSIKNKFSVIGISETWLAHSDHAVDIDNFVHKRRPNRPGGGVGMYTDADLEFKFRDELAIDNWSHFPSSPF